MIKSVLFNLLFLYYWILQLVSYTWINSTNTNSTYYLYIVPITIFILINFIITDIKKLIFNSEIQSLLILVLLITLISIIRFDYRTLGTISLLCLTLVFIVHHNYKLNLLLLNSTYIFTLFYSVYLTFVEVNKYTFFIGLGEGYYEKYASLFPYAIAGSGLFSFYVFAYNFILNKSYSRYFIYIITLYYLFASYNRTSVIVLFVFLFNVLIFYTFKFPQNKIYKILAYVIILSSFLLVFSSEVFKTVNIKNENIDYLINKDDVENDDLKGNARPYMIALQLNDFINNPILGTGTKSFNSEYDLTGTETLLTGLFGRIGISVILLLYFFYNLINSSISFNKKYRYVFIPISIIIFSFYGVVSLPYDMIFFLIYSCYNLDTN